MNQHTSKLVTSQQMWKRNSRMFNCRNTWFYSNEAL